MINLLYFFILIIGVPSFSLFLEKCFAPNMIFRRFRLYMLYWWIKTWRKKDRLKRYLIKPFLCVYCYNTWISIFFYFIFVSTNILFLPIFLGLSYIVLELLLKITQQV